MDNFKVTKLEHTDDEVVIMKRFQALRKLRLQSLQTDANSFVSRYDDEVNQPTEFWLSRIQDPAADHWIAYSCTEAAMWDNSEAEDTAKWIAFLVVLVMDMQPAELPTGVAINTQTHTMVQQYKMAALYVDPAYRRKGVSTKLLSSAIQEIKETSMGQRRVILLEVRKDNAPAQQAYLKLGFVKTVQKNTETTSGEEGRMEIMRLEVSPDPISESLE